MKRFFAFSIISFFFVFSSCMQSSGSLPVGNGYKVRMIDGCQYIEYEYGLPATQGYSYSITHKGNCINPIHKCTCPTGK